MNPVKNKSLIVKLLLVTVLALVALHLTYSHARLGASSNAGPEFSQRHVTVGVDPEDLADYEEVNFLIDSLLTHEFDIQPAWIKNDRIQLENLMYLRKIIQTPFYFPYTLMNIDLTSLVDKHGWNVLSASELLTRQKGQLNVSIDVGRRSVIYQRIDFVTNARLRPAGKEIFFILNGLGSVYDDHVKDYLKLQETFAIHIPKGSLQGAVIELEAEEAGKSVITHLPWSRNVFTLEPANSERELVYNFFETLNNMPNRGFLVLEDNALTYDLIRKQFPRVTKRGYEILRYNPRW